MNSTNRALNRILLALVGLVLVAAGGAVIAAALVRGGIEAWEESSRSTADAIRSSAAQTQAAWLGHSWLLVAAIAAAAVATAMLLWFILRQGRGRTGIVHRRGDRRAGEIAVSTQVPRALLERRLRVEPEVVSVRVSSYRMRREPALKVTIGARTGASVAHLRDLVEASVAVLDRTLGVRLPVVAQITAPLPARLSAPSRIGDEGTRSLDAVPSPRLRPADNA